MTAAHLVSTGRSHAWMLAVGGLILAACGGSSESPTSPSPTPSPVTATLSSIQNEIFTPRCASCHGALAPGGLDLRAANAFANLVNSPSTQTTLMRVAPGDPDASYLVHKLDGRSSIVGSRMPQGGPFLSTTEINVVRAWITAGAPNN